MFSHPAAEDEEPDADGCRQTANDQGANGYDARITRIVAIGWGKAAILNKGKQSAPSRSPQPKNRAPAAKHGAQAPDRH
jgi:hypothetical protein